MLALYVWWVEEWWFSGPPKENYKCQRLEKGALTMNLKRARQPLAVDSKANTFSSKMTLRLKSKTSRKLNQTASS